MATYTKKGKNQTISRQNYRTVYADDLTLLKNLTFCCIV